MTSVPSPGHNRPGEAGGPGLLRTDQGKASVVFRRQLAHPIEDVWEAITDPKKLEVWFMAKVNREPTPHGRLDMVHPNGIHATGEVREWLPPRVYEYEWNTPPGPNQPEGETSVVRWELTPAPGGTLLVLTHSRLSRATAEVFARGLSVLLDRLSASLDHRALPHPPWVAH